MAAKYNVVARKNPRDPDAASKYYPSFVTSGRVTLRQLAEQIANISTVSTIDTLAVLEALLKVLPEHLVNGEIVQLGDFGSFQLRIKSTGSETPEEVNASNIINVLPLFRPSKAFKQALRNTEFRKAE